MYYEEFSEISNAIDYKLEFYKNLIDTVSRLNNSIGVIDELKEKMTELERAKIIFYKFFREHTL